MYNKFNNKYEFYLHSIFESQNRSNINQIIENIGEELKNKGFKNNNNRRRNQTRYDGEISGIKIIIFIFKQSNQIALYKYNSKNGKFSLFDYAISINDIIIPKSKNKINKEYLNQFLAEAVPVNENTNEFSDEDKANIAKINELIKKYEAEMAEIRKWNEDSEKPNKADIISAYKNKLDKIANEIEELKKTLSPKIQEDIKFKPNHEETINNLFESINKFRKNNKKII